MIDLHSHVLPAIDDGPATMEGSLEILRAADADGITKIAATPHVREDDPTTPAQMRAALADVRAAAADEAIAVEVLPGGELDLAFAESLSEDDLRAFGLGGNEKLLLLEFPYYGWPVNLADQIFRYRVRGFSVVLAHPERNAEVHERPERVRELVDGGVFVQLTAAAVDGRLGRRNAAAAKALLDADLAHLIASDAHAPAIRAIGMQSAADAVGDAKLATWLTREVPEALLAGAEPPPRPARRRRWRRQA